jgi:glycine/D-amino acid oxidase-like deaminating enzyme
LASLLTLGLAMARRLQPDLTLTLQPPTAPARTRHLEDLADRLWNRLLTEPGQPPDWRALHVFYLEMELPGWPRLGRRLRHLRILLGRVIEPDYAFAAGLGFHRTWQVRMLRPLRLLSKLTRL